MQHCGCVTITTPQQKFSQLSVKKNKPQTKQKQKQNRDMLEFIWSKGFPILLEERLERRDFAGGVLI